MATVSEITSGSQNSRSVDGGGLADSSTRVFRVLLGTPGESFDIQGACGVSVGDAHPVNTGIRCWSFDSRYENDSRLSLVCTFNYKSMADAAPGGGGPLSQAPDVRPANWSTSVSTYESPAWSWRKVEKEGSVWKAATDRSPAVNTAKDLYDGIANLEPVLTISVEQFSTASPLVYRDAVGCVNKKELIVGGQRMAIGTVMLRSISSQPDVQPWGKNIYRGWKSTYEFLYKKNPARIYNGTAEETVNIGWDIAVPQTGFNCKTFNPAAAGATQDPWGQPLKHSNGKVVLPLALFDNVAAGEKVRAMVKVFSYSDGGASQTPSSQPIALNDDGTPRKDTATPPVLVYRYRIYDEYDFTTMQIRLT
jgi:hypothetical protein